MYPKRLSIARNKKDMWSLFAKGNKICVIKFAGVSINCDGNGQEDSKGVSYLDQGRKGFPMCVRRLNC